jgi:hypothetical protein
MKPLANKIARAILQAIVNDLPIPQREYGRAMLAELEQTDGLQSLEWASGGIQLWIETRGNQIMKNAAFWIGLVATCVLAGGLYVTRGLIWAVPVAAIGIICLSAFRPRDAVPVALLLGLSLPIADLLQIWFMVRSIVSEFNDPGVSINLQNWGTQGNLSLRVGDGQMSADTFGFVYNFPKMMEVSPNAMNGLPLLAISVLLGAIVIAGISAFIRSRVAARNVISQS